MLACVHGDMDRNQPCTADMMHHISTQPCCPPGHLSPPSARRRRRPLDGDQLPVPQLVPATAHHHAIRALLLQLLIIITLAAIIAAILLTLRATIISQASSTLQADQQTVVRQCCVQLRCVRQYADDATEPVLLAVQWLCMAATQQFHAVLLISAACLHLAAACDTASSRRLDAPATQLVLACLLTLCALAVPPHPHILIIILIIVIHITVTLVIISDVLLLIFSLQTSTWHRLGHDAYAYASTAG